MSNVALAAATVAAAPVVPPVFLPVALPQTWLPLSAAAAAEATPLSRPCGARGSLVSPGPSVTEANDCSSTAAEILSLCLAKYVLPGNPTQPPRCRRGRC